MDMDSTLITIECIDEIADFKGIKPEVAAITESAMRGEIDFAQSLTRRVALLAGLPVADLARVYDERLRISPGAERMLAAFKAAGAVTALVSGGFTFFTDRLKARLGLDFTLANTFEVEDGSSPAASKGDIVDAQAKARAIRELQCASSGAVGRHGRRRQRPADVRGSGRVGRLPREAGRAREGNAHDRLLRPRRGGQSLTAERAIAQDRRGLRSVAALKLRRSRPPGSLRGLSRRRACDRRRSPGSPTTQL